MTSRQSIQLNEQKATSLAEAAVAKPSKRQDKSMKTTSMQSTSIIAPTHTREKTRLQPNQLTRLPNLDNIPASTRRIKPLNDFLGQQRARASVEAALSLSLIHI